MGGHGKGNEKASLSREGKSTCGKSTRGTHIIDKEDSLILRSEIPGVKKENLKISVSDDEVSLSGKIERKKEEKEKNYYYCERAYNAWQRTLPLPVRVQSDKAKAKYEDGVLEITLPKVEEAKKKIRELKIE